MNKDRSTSRRLGVILAMQIIILLAMWGATPTVSSVHADGIPDAGAQNQQLIDQAKATNDKLDKILALLSGGDLKVTVRAADEGNKR